MPKFDLGHLMMTPNLQRTLDEHKTGMQELLGFIDRHSNADWGDIDEEDRRANDRALQHGGRLFSAYTTTHGIRLWIIMETSGKFKELAAKGAQMEWSGGVEPTRKVFEVKLEV